MKPVVWKTQLLSSVLLTVTSALAPCSHEEVDSRIFVHVKDMSQQEKNECWSGLLILVWWS